MARFIGLAVDTSAAGSTYDGIGGVSPTWAPPTIFLPVESAQVSPGYRNTDRGNEVRGQRGNVPMIAFQADPTATFTVRLYPSLLKFLLPKALGGAALTTGVAPAALTTAFGASATSLYATQLMLVRDNQTDRLSGCWIDSVSINVPEDGDPMMTVNVRALFHKHYVTSAPPTPTYTNESPYSTLTLKTLVGPSATVIPCVASLALTYDNQLKDEAKLRYCKGENIEVTTVGGKYTRRQYPGKHKLGDQQITGTLEFGDVRTDFEDRARLATAEKLVFELTSDRISPATTPPADELLRLTIPAAQVTGGGPGELTDDTESDSTYEIGGYIDPATGDSFKAEFVTGAAVALNA